jgi:bifunctional DNase/RNase
MIEVLVSRLGLDSATNSYVVVLQERGGTRLLPIWIGQPEAESIVRHMHNVKGMRPLTHDLVRNLIVGMGAQLKRVHITRVEKSTYYAELQIQRGETLVHIDARPSDSIAIALRLAAPIYAADELMVEPAEEEDEDGGGETPGIGENAEEVETAETDPSELSADQLKAYLENLRPEDFGKFNP